MGGRGAGIHFSIVSRSFSQMVWYSFGCQAVARTPSNFKQNWKMTGQSFSRSCLKLPGCRTNRSYTVHVEFCAVLQRIAMKSKPQDCSFWEVPHYEPLCTVRCVIYGPPQFHTQKSGRTAHAAVQPGFVVKTKPQDSLQDSLQDTFLQPSCKDLL